MVIVSSRSNHDAVAVLGGGNVTIRICFLHGNVLDGVVR